MCVSERTGKNKKLIHNLGYKIKICVIFILIQLDQCK